MEQMMERLQAIMANTEASQEACLENMEATNLKENPEETRQENQEVPNEEAAVETIGELVD
jgi:hypothetical protein